MEESGDEGSESEYGTEDEYSADEGPGESSKVVLFNLITFAMSKLYIVSDCFNL